MTDEEMFGAACALSAREAGCASPSQIPTRAKLEIARKLHFDYHATNGQLRRILKLPSHLLEEMFPLPSLKQGKNMDGNTDFRFPSTK